VTFEQRDAAFSRSLRDLSLVLSLSLFLGARWNSAVNSGAPRCFFKERECTPTGIK